MNKKAKTKYQIENWCLLSIGHLGHYNHIYVKLNIEIGFVS